MNKHILVGSVALALIIATVTNVALSARTRKVNVNSRSIPEQNLELIDSTSPAFASEFANARAGRQPAEEGLPEQARPFTIILKNRARQDLVAYSVKWEVLLSNGQTITHQLSFSDPGSLTGRIPAEPGAPAGARIRQDSARVVSVYPLAEHSDPSMPDAANLGLVSGSADQMNTADQTQLKSEISKTLANEMRAATDVTVSLDVAIFEDGMTAGPDTMNYFGILKAEVSAKNDLARGALRAIRAGKKVSNVLDDFETMAKRSDIPKVGKASPSEYYLFYRAKLAAEISNIRKVTGDDQKAIWYLIEPLTRKWPNLHTKNQNSH